MKAAPGRLHEIVKIARRLAEELGEAGAGVISGRARSLEAAGEVDDARFWADVARAMRLMDVRPGR